jgi:hypothetical protein
VYAGKYLLRKAVHNWVEKFSQVSLKVADDVRPNCPVETATEAAVRRMAELLRADGRITIGSAATAPWFSIQNNAWSLKFRKVCAWWVPRERKDQEKMNRMCLSLQHLLRYADEEQDMLNKIVTGDESRVHHYQPESNRASVQWKHPSSPTIKTLEI